MDSWGIRRTARYLGVRLSVTPNDELLCDPAERLTPELREAIRASKDNLLFDVLLADALRYVAVERHVEGADVSVVLDAHQMAIDAAYLTRDWPAFRVAIRAFVKEGMRVNQRARLTIEASGPPTDCVEPQRDRRASSSGVRSRRRERGVREPAGSGAASED